MRYVLEGTWTGYVSRQSRVVHREVISEKRADVLRGIHKIVYTDGTALLLNVREAKPRERVEVNDSYGSLIRDAEKAGKSVVYVADLYAKPAESAA
jgi:hypothetical protein